MAGRVTHPGEGTAQCLGHPVTGEACRKREIEGLERCLHHVTDDLLDEAEEITGISRCRKRFGQDDACRQYAVAGTDPPACKNHGANTGSYQSKLAAERVVEGRIMDAATAMARGNLEALLDPEPETDPIGRMREMCGLARDWEREARKVMLAMGSGHWRYQTGRVGEQTRAELLVWERAIERCYSMNEKFVRLGVDAIQAGIREKTARHIEERLDAALAATGLDAAGRQRAREAFRDGLKVIA